MTPDKIVRNADDEMIDRPSAGWPIRHMSHIVNKHLRDISLALRPLGLTAPMWRVLNGLVEGGPSSVGELASHAAFERSYVSRLVEQMIANGLVSRLDDKVDRRLRIVTLTRLGRKQQRAAAVIVHRLNRASVARISASELTQLFGMLNRIATDIGADRPRGAAVADPAESKQVDANRPKAAA